MTKNASALVLLKNFAFFWLFLAAYKFGAVLHYSLLSPLGSELMPLWVVGFLIGGEAFFQMLLDVPAGHLVDRYGRKRMLGIGLISFLIAALLLMQLTVTSYIASIVFSLFGWLFLSPAVNAYLLAYTEHTSSGRFLSFRDTFSSLGMASASIGLVFILALTPASMGLILLVSFLVSAVFLFISPKDKSYNVLEQKLPAQGFHIRRTFLKDAVRAFKRLNIASKMLSAYSFSGGVFYGTVWFVVPLLIASDISTEFLGIGLGVFDFAIVTLGFVIGSIVDRSDKRLLVFYGLLVFAIMGMALGFSFGPLFLLFGFLATAGDETTNLSLWSWLHSLDKEHAHDGAVAGAISFTEDMGYTVGPILAGVTFSVFGPTWAIVIGALPLLVLWVAYSFFVRPVHFELPSLEVPQMPMRRRHKGYR
ncbi:MAG: MFS transporter [Candidatus Pacebacteria bacterium]|nr:MFS transporter [Candidatus Paceibacterota bacterium]